MEEKNQPSRGCTWPEWIMLMFFFVFSVALAAHRSKAIEIRVSALEKQHPPAHTVQMEDAP